MFGLTFEKLLLIGVIAAFVIGPDKLPEVATRLTEAIKWVRGASTDAKTRVREELGDDIADLDWRKLDPRQYDPRRIIREALLEEDPAPQRLQETTGTNISAPHDKPQPLDSSSRTSRPDWALNALIDTNIPNPGSRPD